MVIREPLAVARAFFKAMRDYFAENDAHRRDAIAAHQLDVLRRCRRPPIACLAVLSQVLHTPA